LNQEQLARACFPLGTYTKEQVRAMAAERGLPVASKPESQEICFVARDDYRGFIQRYAASRAAVGVAGGGGGDGGFGGFGPALPVPRPGPIYDREGNLLGEHRGLAFYTIGQRRGLGLTSSRPLHVLKIDAERNALIVGPAEALERTSFTVHSMHYLSGDVPAEPFEAAVRIRYKASEQRARVTPLEGQRALVVLEQPVRAVTPGQGAVFYGGADGDEVLCGGIIEA
jgi:tRNA-specific 2-thiouridylase